MPSVQKRNKWRKSIFQKNKYICVFCGQKGGELQADHIKPLFRILEENNIKTYEQALNCKELWDINNGRTLCVNCHRKTDTWGNHK